LNEEDSMNAPRRHFGTDQKATILKRYLVDKVPISDLCDEYGIKPNQVYAWQKMLFDNAATAFHPVAKREARRLSAQEEKIARLETKLQQKNEVISELMEENLRAKKSIGEL
jgi:transposase-like protein